MSNIPLNSIKFPELNNTYTIPQLDETLAVEGDAAESSAVGAALNTKADKDGTYPNLTAGLADMATQLKSTVGITDEEPYLFRTSGGSADIGDFETDKIVGGSVAWNQLVDKDKFVQATYTNITTTPNNDGSITVVVSDTVETTTNVLLTANTGTSYIKVPIDHKYMIYDSCERVGECVYSNQYNGSSMGWNNVRSQIGVNNILLSFRVVSGTPAGTYKIHPQLFDLTLMFGSTIADYIYSLEQATGGAGVAWFRKLFPKSYYAYNPGTLIHVGNISKHRMVGFNQWDEEWESGRFDTTTGANIASETQIRSKNYIPVLPDTSYYLKSSYQVWTMFYDANHNLITAENLPIGTKNANALKWGNETKTTPDNCHYIRFYCQEYYGATYNHDICINLSWDGERDGEYAPYAAYEYPLDADFYLLGVPKLDANNRLYFDGDEYASDGTVTQRYGMVDLGSLTWSYTGGTYSRMQADISGIKQASSADAIANILCSKYTTDSVGHVYAHVADKTIGVHNTLEQIWVYDSDYSDAAAFKTARSGVYLVYERAEPMYAQSDPYENPQRVDDFGTEEYVAEPFGTNDVIVPVGHRTFYQANLRAKLEMAPNSPDGDGDYIVRQANGENTYVPLVITPEVQVVNQSFDYDPSISVEAGAITSTDFALNVPTGYIPAMVVVVGTNNLNAFAIMEQNFSVSPAKLLVTLKNITDTTRTLSFVEANILYVKSS